MTGFYNSGRITRFVSKMQQMQSKHKRVDQWYGFRIHSVMRYKAINDRTGIYLENENEIRKISRKLKYSLDDIICAIQEVGFDENEIEEYIRDRYDRGF